ncbi:hypothetical protein C7T87_00830 [Xanthomonas hortorum pv. hederae]|nr:hypothetical protein C7T87_00830 [Xanthomonas hortorum pv. hederae]
MTRCGDLVADTQACGTPCSGARAAECTNAPSTASPALDALPRRCRCHPSTSIFNIRIVIAHPLPRPPLPRLRARARLHEWSTMHAFELPNCHDAVS